MAVDGKSIAAVGLKNSEVQKLLRGKKEARLYYRFTEKASRE